MKKHQLPRMSCWLPGHARFTSLILQFFLWPCLAHATIHYEISVAEREAHVFRVTAKVAGVRDSLRVQMPAWNALYQIRDFAYRVRELRATDSSGARLEVEKLDKQTWVVRGPYRPHEVVLTYGVDWDEPSPFSSQLNTGHAFINLATVLVYFPERRREDVRLAFSGLPANWRVGTALKPAGAEWIFVAVDYDALVDAPVEIGQFEEFRFVASSSAGDARVRVVVHSDRGLSGREREQLTETLRRIVSTQTALMQEIPFEEFLFLYHFGRGGGGMEHANSTAIHAGGVETVASVSAHEFFHLWNVKRIRPRSLEPVDYTRENWTRALWFAEGVTSTYAAYTLVRSKLWTPQQFYEDLAAEISQLESRPARHWKSVEEASLDAWHEKYQLFRRPTHSISYYNKGQILGVLLDILIRDATDNRRSLDDVLRSLNLRFARRGAFYDERRDLLSTVNSVSGANFESFFQRYVAGTEDLPYGEILGKAGLALQPGKGERAFVVQELPDITDRQRRIREGLLTGRTD